MRRFVAALGVAVLTLAASATPADANHSWNGYHWSRAANPFTVPLGDNLTSAWDGYLITASSDWSVSTVLDTGIQAGSTTGRKCRASSRTVQVCNAAYGRNGWLGLASIWISGGHITQGTVKVNDTYFAMASYNNVNEKLHVMCQEIGHTFGPTHQDESGISLDTCMDYYHNTGDADTKSTRPNQHDYDQLVTIYTSHYDAAAGAAVVVGGGGAGAAGDAGDGDGTPPGASRARGSWYVQEFGQGRTLLTHVFWAPGGH